MAYNPFEEYIKETEPDKRYKSLIWATAIGLQDVDGLKTSKFLETVARDNIEGKITLEQAQENINNYYQEDNKNEKILTEEGDKVSANIVKVLSEKAFSLSPTEYISIHRKIFNGVYKNAGKIRNYNITKKEWVLNGDTVIYGTASDLKTTLEYDLLQEKNFSFESLSIEETIEHLADFISKLWQIHIFEEGNTRTTAIFLIKYLRTLGYDVTNDLFSQKAKYFRNSLVRANYNNVKLGINKTTKYLILFFRNLLLGENNKLQSRYLHIDKKVVEYIKEIEKNKKVDIQDKNVDIQDKKVDIQDKKVDIQDKKVDIRDKNVDIQDKNVDIQDKNVDIQDKNVDIRDKNVDIQDKKVDIQDKKVDIQDKNVDIQDKNVDIQDFSEKTQENIKKLYKEFGNTKIFGRNDVQNIIGLKPARISILLKELLLLNIIEPISGHGKGKYRFTK